MRKDITKIFKDLGLKVTIECNKKVVNFLDVTLDLNTGNYYPYKKPNDELLYVHKNSNHPPNIIKDLPKMIERRLSHLSSNEDIFNRAKPEYEKALKDSGFSEKLVYRKPNPERQTKKKNRKRKIIWFNPPFSRSVETNVAKIFLNLVKKHFPSDHRYHKIFNKNNVKVSYSCMENMESRIKKHNSKVLNPPVPDQNANQCNCQNKPLCPLGGNCRQSNVIYKCAITTSEETKHYIGATAGEIKHRISFHKTSCTDEKYKTSSELSKYVWSLKERNIVPHLEWQVIDRSNAYRAGSKKCNLCITEKLHINNGNERTINKRSELVSKCRHENKFYLSNYKETKKKPRQ